MMLTSVFYWNLGICLPFLITRTLENNLPSFEQKANIFRTVVNGQLEVFQKPISTWFLIRARNTSLSLTVEECDINPLIEYLLNTHHSWTSDQASPTLLGDLLEKKLRRKHVTLTSFQVVVPLCPNNIIDKLKKVQSIGSKRKDHYVFISENESTLMKAFEDPIVIKRKEKIGIAWGSLTILEEPSIFDPTGKYLTRIVDGANWKPQMKPYFGQNLPGRHIRVSASILPPYFFIRPENDPKSIDYYDGNHYRIFSETYARFNYTFEVRSTAVGEGYGNLLPNGTWTGMIAEVYYEERGYDAVVILGPLIVWYDMFEFAGTMGVAHLLFLTRHPTLEISTEAFLNPYTKAVWIGVIISFISTVITVVGATLLSNGRPLRINSKSLGSSVQNALQLTYTIALEQNGAKVNPNLRILAGIWMICTIITSTGYKCNLASYLSSPTAASVPSNYEQLAARKDYTVILNNIGAAEYEFFQTSQGTTIQSLRKRMTYIVDSIDCATKALVNPSTACIAWCPFMTLTAAGALTLDTKRSPLLFSKQGALTTGISVAFQKDSVYVDAFIPITQAIYESGLYTLWEKDAIHYHKQVGRQRMLGMKDSEAYKSLSSYEESLNRGPVNPFTVKNLKVSFYLIILGAIISTASLICEWGYNDFWDNNPNEG